MSFYIENHNDNQITREDVIDYLNVFPEFLIENSDKIDFFKRPKQDVFRLLNVYRIDNKNLMQSIRNIIDIADENYQILSSLTQMNLILNQTSSLNEVVSYIHHHFVNEFEIPFVRFFWNQQYFGIDLETSDFIEEKIEEHFYLIENEYVNHLFNREIKPIVRERKCPVLKKAFPDRPVKTGLILPLQIDNKLLGFLALGSDKKRRFHRGLGYDFLMNSLYQITGNLAFFVSKILIFNKTKIVTQDHFFSFLRNYRKRVPPIRNCFLLKLNLQRKLKNYDEIKNKLRIDDLIYPESEYSLWIIPHGLLKEDFISEALTPENNNFIQSMEWLELDPVLSDDRE